jgi:hypothetical protein
VSNLVLRCYHAHDKFATGTYTKSLRSTQRNNDPVTGSNILLVQQWVVVLMLFLLIQEKLGL